MKNTDNKKALFKKKIVNTALVKKNNKYFLIEELLKSNEISQYMKKNEPMFYRLYQGCGNIYIDANTNEIIDISDYENCMFVNTRNMYSEEFLNSEFFNKYHLEIVLNIMHIKGQKKLFDLRDKTNYKPLETADFLTCEFSRMHYQEIFDTLDDISLKKEASKKSRVKTKSKTINGK